MVVLFFHGESKLTRALFFLIFNLKFSPPASFSVSPLQTMATRGLAVIDLKGANVSFGSLWSSCGGMLAGCAQLSLAAWPRGSPLASLVSPNSEATQM